MGLRPKGISLAAGKKNPINPVNPFRKKALKIESNHYYITSNSLPTLMNFSNANSISSLECAADI